MRKEMGKLIHQLDKKIKDERMGGMECVKTIHGLNNQIEHLSKALKKFNQDFAAASEKLSQGDKK